MRVLFSNPPWWDGTAWKWGVLPLRRVGVRAGSRWPFTYPSLSFPGWRAPFEYLTMPFFMTFAAAYARQHTGAEVVVRDSIARRESYTRFFRAVAQGGFDFIFIESASPSWEHDARLIRRLHEVSPGSRLVVCGPITSEKADSILAELPVTACIQGEYEKGAVAVLQGRTGVLHHDLLTESEMNAAPWPLYDEDAATAYYDRNPRGVRLPQAQVWASRGCPFKCIFCVWPATMTGNDPDGAGQRTVRRYSPEWLEPFFRHILARYRYRSIYFDDDTFNLGTRHTEAICDLMRRIGLPWAAMCRADTVRPETWEHMRRSGCYGVKLGIETGNQYVMDKIVNKSLDLGLVREVTARIKRLGMTVHGTFTIGLPGETPDQMRETLAFAHSLGLDSMQISGTAEIEGTPLHTLRTRGSLAAFEGARVDADYDRDSDGAKKWDRLIRDLREG
jgi:radical SAM superfamily enzyme YgiQ (UPF0313 family)